MVLGISLEMPNGYFDHVGTFSEEVSEMFGIGFEFEFIQKPYELVRLIAIEFNEYGIELREEDYDHLLEAIGGEMLNLTSVNPEKSH